MNECLCWWDSWEAFIKYIYIEKGFLLKFDLIITAWDSVKWALIEIEIFVLHFLVRSIHGRPVPVVYFDTIKIASKRIYLSSLKKQPFALLQTKYILWYLRRRRRKICFKKPLCVLGVYSFSEFEAILFLVRTPFDVFTFKFEYMKYTANLK